MIGIRKVLFILGIGSALLGFLPLVPYLGTVARLVFAAAFIGCIVAERRGWRLAPAVSTTASLFLFVLYLVQVHRDNLVGPAVNLLVALLAVRLVSEKSPRNYLQIFALSLFALASSSLFSLSALFIVYLVLLLVLIALSLVILTFYQTTPEMIVARRGLMKIFAVSAIMPAGALPLMLVFFVILPRTQFPLWGGLNMVAAKATGFAEVVKPGSSANVVETRNVVFRAQCERLPREGLYWRGIVLNAFDGTAWVRRAAPSGEVPVPSGGDVVRQTMYPEPSKNKYLFALDVPWQVKGVRAVLTPDSVAVGSSPPGRRVKYDVVSHSGSAMPVPKGIDRGFYLGLPPRLSGRMAELGRSIGRKGRTDAEKVALLEEFYRKQHITYAITNLPVAADPLDEFLFSKKRGNCEYFASSFALLLRLTGVPSRLVGGYFGGEYNDIGGYYVVSDDMAHVWVEACINGREWRRVDPSGLAVNSTARNEAERAGIGRRLQMYLDALDYYWNLTVISYDLESQLQLVSGVGSRLGMRRFHFRPTPGLIAAIFLPFLAAVVIFTARKRATSSLEEKMVRRFLMVIRKRFRIEPLADSGLHELASLVNDSRVDSFVSIYGRAVYRDRKLSPEEIRTLNRLLRELVSGK